MSSIPSSYLNICDFMRPKILLGYVDTIKAILNQQPAILRKGWFLSPGTGYYNIPAGLPFCFCPLSLEFFALESNHLNTLLYQRTRIAQDNLRELMVSHQQERYGECQVNGFSEGWDKFDRYALGKYLQRTPDVTDPMNVPSGTEEDKLCYLRAFRRGAALYGEMQSPAGGGVQIVDRLALSQRNFT